MLKLGKAALELLSAKSLIRKKSDISRSDPFSAVTVSDRVYDTAFHNEPQPVHGPDIRSDADFGAGIVKLPEIGQNVGKHFSFIDRVALQVLIGFAFQGPVFVLQKSRQPG